MKKKETQLWIPLWVDKWIFGSTRLELDPAQRGIWIDLMAIAAKDNGYIRANPSTPYQIKQLAGLLCVTEDLLVTTIERCLDPEVGKLEKTEFGTLHLVNWENFQLTPKYKARITPEPKKNQEDTQPGSMIEPSGSIMESAFLSSPIISYSFNLRKWEGVEPADIASWKESFPACDVEGELKRMGEWLTANPNKRKSNYRRFIFNWLSRTQDRGGSSSLPRNSAPPRQEYKVSQIGTTEKQDHDDDYWAEVRRLKGQGIEGDALTAAMVEWRKTHPERVRFKL